MRTKRPTSIAAAVRRNVWSVAALLVIPVVTGLILMLVYTDRYQGMIRRMDTAARIKPVVETELARDLFSVTAGRTDYPSSGVEEKIRAIDGTLETLLKNSRGSGAVQLTVARRTMDTLEHYADEIRDGMAQKRPVSQIEAVVDEVWQVGELVGDKIDAFLAEEIESAAEASRRIREVLLGSAAAEILLLIFALIWTRTATRRLTGAIGDALTRLEETVGRIAEGRFGERVSKVDVTELKTLAGRINTMAERLEGLIEQNRLKQEHLAKAEMRTLQAQINPHFLYNTLDTIVWQAESGKAEDVIRLTRSLSDFFRISLSAGADWIPAGQELRHAEAYLSIQKIRYRDILNYEVTSEGDLKDAWVPKLILQPLVENALYHGIKARRGGGTIRVSARRDGDEICFAVADTGKGMDPGRLEDVRRSLDAEAAGPGVLSDPEGKGFGLRNVDQRLRLYYRRDEGLVITSDDTGTIVTFTVPVRGKEELEHDESVSRG